MHEDKLPELFKGKVTTPVEGCWEWQMCRNSAGYGEIRVAGKHWLAHRYAYTTCVADIPEDLVVMHSCDNPACVRLKHLRLGTHASNMLDRIMKGKGNEGQRNGMAKLTERDVAEIREFHSRGMSQSDLGRAFNVNRSCIWKIVHNTHWSKP